MANQGHEPSGQPPPLALPRLPAPQGAADKPLAGLRAGVFRPWCKDAHPAVVAGFEAGVAALVAAGVELVDIAIPELELLRAAHACTISCEMRNSMCAGAGF